ncbi:response regulator [Propionibacterium sp.]|uniref:response regulator n=1 Tax=Propionibacterium sp. TaxID=1977903 RepID=UPI0039E7F4FF
MTDPVRVVLADDHPVYRAGLAGLIQVTDDLEVVAQASDGEQAVRQCRDVHPDVAVLDLKMPGMDGLSATREIVTLSPGTAVLVLSMFDDDATVIQTMRAGARGYLVKSESPDTILAAIRSVAHGEAVFSASLASRMTEWFSSLDRTQTSLGNLTPREQDVLRLMCHGRDNPDIARQLGISDKTVRNVVSNVFAKLHVADRASAISVARGSGLG